MSLKEKFSAFAQSQPRVVKAGQVAGKAIAISIQAAAVVGGLISFKREFSGVITRFTKKQ